jgi:hypothetical protein
LTNRSSRVQGYSGITPSGPASHSLYLEFDVRC